VAARATEIRGDTVAAESNDSHSLNPISLFAKLGLGFFGGISVFRRFSQRFSSVFFARPKSAFWRLWSVQKNAEPMRGLEFRRKTKPRLFHRENKTQNQVFKPKHTCFFPTPVLQTWKQW